MATIDFMFSDFSNRINYFFRNFFTSNMGVGFPVIKMYLHETPLFYLNT